MKSVLKDWVFTLPFRMQSVLMSGLRGCDIARKDDNSKFITRALRAVLLNNADPSNTFIVGSGIPEDKYVTAFLWDLDSYPMHFVMHTAHAAEIVGYKHPDATLRAWWKDFYEKLIKGLHVNPEQEDQLDVRLGVTPAEQGQTPVSISPAPTAAPSELINDVMETRSIKETPKPKVKVKKKKRVWDAGTGTSHGGRDRDYSGSS
jgi:hypothetical protein